jgi:hypothetical protein
MKWMSSVTCESTDEACPDGRSDPTVVETDRLRKRIAELEQVVRELRQKNPSRAAPAVTIDDSDEDKRRRVIIDRLAKFKIDEVALAELAAAAAKGVKVEADGETISPPLAGGSLSTIAEENQDYKKPYNTHLLPGEEMVRDRIGRKTFLGAPAGKSMLRRVSLCIACDRR